MYVIVAMIINLYVVVRCEPKILYKEIGIDPLSVQNYSYTNTQINY